MSRTSEYTLELQIKDDKSKDALRELEKRPEARWGYGQERCIGKDLTNNLEESQKAAQSIIDRFYEMAKDPELDFEAVSKAYSKNAGKAIAELEKQYAVVKDQLDAAQKKHDENVEALKSYNALLKNQNLTDKERSALKAKINVLKKEQAIRQLHEGHATRHGRE